MNKLNDKNSWNGGQARLTENTMSFTDSISQLARRTTKISDSSIVKNANPDLLHEVIHSRHQPWNTPSLHIRESGKLGNNKISPALPNVATHSSLVSMISGEALVEQTDFELPGAIPLSWKRTYRSSHSRDLGLGAGWAAPYLCRLFLENDKVIFADGEGRLIPFLRPPRGEGCCNTVEQLTLHCHENPVDGEDSFTLVDRNTIEWRFNGHGDTKYLYSTRIANRYYVRYHCNESGRLTLVRDSTGRKIKLDYNMTDRLREVNLLDNNDRTQGKPLVQYHYNYEGDLVSVTDAGGNTHHYQYHNHIIHKYTNKDGYSRYFQWDRQDTNGKCVHFWGHGNIHDRVIVYDDARKITQCTDGCGHPTVFHYNDLGLVTRNIHPEDGISEFEYDDIGRLLLARDPAGNITQFEYDDNSQLIRLVDPLGHTTRFEYDQLGRLINLSDALGMRWRRRYDEKGLLASIVDPLGYELQYQHDDKGNLTVITNAMRRSLRQHWSENGLLLAKTDAAGNRQDFRYDTAGRLTEVNDHNQAWRFCYDILGRLSDITNFNGDTVHLEYTAEGYLARFTDALGRITKYLYDGLPQLIKRTNPYGQSFIYGYDKERNLTAIMNENGDRCEYFYDKNHRLCKEISIDRREQHYGYNAAGHLVSHSDGANRVTQYKRDALGRITKKWSSDQDISRYEYDPLGRLIHAHNKDSDLEFKFSDNGQLIEERQNNQRLRHEYDLTNLRTATSISKTERIEYEYNAQGLLKRVTYNYKPLTGITRNIQGQEIVRTSGGVNSVFAYDSMRRLIHHRVTKGQVPLMERNYTYDSTGKLQQIKDLETGKTVFKYDALNRIRAAVGAMAERFNYDPSDNLLDARQAFTRSRIKGNRITVFKDYRFEYDDVGNIILEIKGKKRTRYTYNTQNQLVKVEKSPLIFEYVYDPLGRRVKKTGASGETIYLWDGAILLGERHKNLHVTYVHEPGSCVPLYLIRNGEIFFYHNTLHGSPRMITNYDGDIVWQACYKVNGGMVSHQSTAVDNPIGFRGWYHDRETGLYYNGHRYYHPVIGRYIHQDPRGLADGSNTKESSSRPLEPHQWLDLYKSLNPSSPFYHTADSPETLRFPPIPDQIDDDIYMRQYNDHAVARTIDLWPAYLKRQLPFCG